MVHRLMGPPILGRGTETRREATRCARVDFAAAPVEDRRTTESMRPRMIRAASWGPAPPADRFPVAHARTNERLRGGGSHPILDLRSGTPPTMASIGRPPGRSQPCGHRAKRRKSKRRRLMCLMYSAQKTSTSAGSEDTEAHLPSGVDRLAPERAWQRSIGMPTSITTDLNSMRFR